MGNFEETLDFSHTDRISANGHSDVNCDGSSGIDVLIVGAGVGGLVAALECARATMFGYGSVPGRQLLEVSLKSWCPSLSNTKI